MNKEELIGKLQMVYVGDTNTLNELIGYYDGLKQGIDELQQENQKLKKQLEVGKEQYNDLVEEKEELQEQLSNSHQIKNQQKEFIQWLENESKEVIRDAGYHQRICLEILSKYKEIIGGDNK